MEKNSYFSFTIFIEMLIALGILFTELSNVFESQYRKRYNFVKENGWIAELAFVIVTISTIVIVFFFHFNVFVNYYPISFFLQFVASSRPMTTTHSLFLIIELENSIDTLLMNAVLSIIFGFHQGKDHKNFLFFFRYLLVPYQESYQLPQQRWE